MRRILNTMAVLLALLFLVACGTSGSNSGPDGTPDPGGGDETGNGDDAGNGDGPGDGNGSGEGDDNGSGGNGDSGEALTIEIHVDGGSEVTFGSTLRLRAAIGGPGSEDAKVTWKAEAAGDPGSFHPRDGTETTWTAPGEEGAVTVTATVTSEDADVAPASASKELTVLVPLRLEGISAARTVGLGSKLQLTAELDGYYAADATVTWTYTHSGAGEAGQLTATSGSATAWQAPLSEGGGHAVTAAATYAAHDGGERTHEFEVVLCDSGNFTQNNPCVISNLHQLQGIAAEEGRLEGHYRLGTSIDATATQEADWADGHGFLPIGNHPDASAPFSGSFDGAGHSIDGLHMDYPTVVGVGLFRALVGGATVRNVTLTDAQITGRQYVGALAGGAEQATVSGVTVESAEVTAQSGAGGLLGLTMEDATVTDAVASGVTVRADEWAGGLVAANAGTLIDVQVRDSRISSVQQLTGGISAGNAGTITGALVKGTEVESTSSWTGGLIGLNGAGGRVESSRVEDSTVTSAAGETGGFAGSALSASNGIADSEVEDVNVTTEDGAGDTGGFIGLNGTEITGSWVRGGNVRADGSRVGGFAGNNSKEGRITGATASQQNITVPHNAQGRNIGGLVGFNGGVITDSRALNQELQSFGGVGGLVGGNGDFAQIHASGAESSAVRTTGAGTAGGFVASNSGEITESYVREVSVTGSDDLGGFAGFNNSGGNIGKSFVFSPDGDGNVEATHNSAGGFVGANAGSISQSWTIVRKVSGVSHVGGFAGRIRGQSLITESYAGSVLEGPTGAADVGGFIGWNEDSNHNNVVSSFWSPQIARVNVSAGGTSRTILGLQNRGTYTAAGWSFSGPGAVWQMPPSGDSYGTPDLIDNSRF